MLSRKGFTLTEILIAVVLMGLVILAVTSVDITSRRFFAAASKQARVQDEAKLAMEHIVKHVQQGIGDMTNAGNIGDDPHALNSSRGFYILDNGNLANSGSRIQVKIDGSGDGQFKTTDYPQDKMVEYSYDAASFKIVYDPDINPAAVGDEEDLAEDIVQSAIFIFDDNIPNQVEVEIEALRYPTEAPGLENPQTILTSSIILRAMSCK